MSCYTICQDPCNYNPCQYHTCTFCYNISLGDITSTVSLNSTTVGNIVLTFGAPTEGWGGSGSYTADTSSSPLVFVGEAKLTRSPCGCCLPTFSLPVIASGPGNTTGIGSLDFTINNSIVTLEESTIILSGTISGTITTSLTKKALQCNGITRTATLNPKFSGKLVLI